MGTKFCDDDDNDDEKRFVGVRELKVIQIIIF